MNRKNTQALSVDAAAKYVRVLELRRVGFTFDQIATEVGYAGRQGAKEAYDAAIARMGREPAEDLRTLENDRLDDLWRRAYNQLAKLDPDDVDGLTKLEMTMIRISQRRAGLMGLDAPRQVELSGSINAAITSDIGEVLKERIGLVENDQPLNGQVTDEGQTFDGS
jgi:hypothetical protein